MSRHSNALRFLIASVAALVVVTGFNAMVDAGAMLHDLACPEHGWLA